MIDPSKIDAQLDEALRDLSQQHTWVLNDLSAAFAPNPRVRATDLMRDLDGYVSAKAKVALLELIRSPDFYNAIMRSAAEVAP